MSELPTLSNTWTIDPNNQACDSGVDTLLECHQKTLFTLKNLLINFSQPWVVVKSSNSVSHTDVDGYADYWDDSTDLIWSSGNHSWIVLQHPIWDFQLCLDLNNVTGSGRLLSCYISHAGLFFGGSLSNRPVAQDEVYVFINENWIGNNIAAFDAWVHTWESNTRQQRVLITTSEGDGEGMFWSFHEQSTISDLWSGNRVSMIVTHRGVAGGGCLDLSRMMVTGASNPPAGIYSATNPVALLSTTRDIPTSGAFSKRSIRFNLPEYTQNNFLDVPSYSAIEFGNADSFTISSWFRTISRTTGGQTIVGKKNNLGAGYAVFVNGSSSANGPGLIQVQIANSIPTNDAIRLFSANRFDDGDWHHLVVTYDGSGVAAGVEIYVDGVIQDKIIGFDALVGSISTTTSLRFGNDNAGSFGQIFIGSIDDVAIFNKSLSQLEVNEVYNSGIPFDLRTSTVNSYMVGYWLMGDGDTSPVVKDRSNSTPILASEDVLDRSVSGNNGTPMNMEDADFVNDTPGGISGYSSLLDGTNEYINVGDVSELQFDFSDSFSISAWFKSSSSTNQIIFSKARDSGFFEGYAVFLFNTGAILIRLEGGGANNNKIEAYTVNTGFADGSWHHIVITYDGSSTLAGLDVVIDDVAQSLTTTTDAASNSMLTTIPFQIGARNGGTTFNGNIDEVSVFNKKLSLAEVSTIYNSGSPPDITLIGNLYPNLVGYWGMGELHNDATAFGGLNQNNFYGDSSTNPLMYLKLGSQLADPDDINTSSMLTERDLSNSPNGLESTYPFIIDDGPNEFSSQVFNIGLGNYQLDGTIGSYLNFDGVSDFISFGNILGFQPDDPFSVSLWYRSSETAAFHPLISRFIQGTFRGWECTILTAGNLSFRLTSTNLSNDLRVDSSASDPTWRDGNWKNFIFTYDGSTNASGVNIYVNGSLIPTTTVHNNLTNPITYSVELYIARRPSSSFYVDADMKDVAIFNEELDSNKVAAIYNSGTPVDIYDNVDGYFTDSNVLAYWRLGEVRGEQNFPITPISLISDYGYRGLHGYMPDMYWGSDFVGNVTYPRSFSNKALVQFENIILPWTNDSTNPSFLISAANGDDLAFETVGGSYTGAGDTVGGATINFYFLMTGIDTGAPSQPSYHSWVVIGSPDPTGAQAIGPNAPPFGGPLTNIVVSGQWSV